MFIVLRVLLVLVLHVLSVLVFFLLLFLLLLKVRHLPRTLPLFVEIYMQNAGRPGYHLDWSPDLHHYRTNPSCFSCCYSGCSCSYPPCSNVSYFSLFFFLTRLLLLFVAFTRSKSHRPELSITRGGPQKRFRTETRIRWCFRHFSRIFGCLSARGYWNGILGHFGSLPAMEKRPKMKKTLYIAKICRVFGCQSIENTAKTSVLDWRYSKKPVNYLDWKHYKNTVKSNVLEGFTAFMAKNV